MIRDLGDANPYAAQANLFPQANKIYTNTTLFTFIHNSVMVCPGYELDTRVMGIKHW